MSDRVLIVSLGLSRYHESYLFILNNSFFTFFVSARVSIPEIAGTSFSMSHSEREDVAR